MVLIASRLLALAAAFMLLVDATPQSARSAAGSLTTAGGKKPPCKPQVQRKLQPKNKHKGKKPPCPPNKKKFKKTKSNPKPKSQPKEQPKPQITPQVKPYVTPQVKPQIKPQVKPQMKPQVKPQPTPKTDDKPQHPQAKPTGKFPGAKSVRATFYGTDLHSEDDQPPYPPYQLGSCGKGFEPSNHKYFVAMNHGRYGKGMCGQCLRITAKSTGRSTIGPVVDMCPSCGSGLDISLPMMAELAGSVSKAVDLGIMNVDYEFVTCPPGISVR